MGNLPYDIRLNFCGILTRLAVREGADLPRVCERMRTRLVVSEPVADHVCWVEAYGSRYFPGGKIKDV